MATISTYPFVRHLRSSATSHVEYLKGGKPQQSGVGAAFWFRPMSAAISEVPVNDREQDVLVRVRTTDAQEVTVPGTVTYRFAEPARTASRVDFSINTLTGAWADRPLEVVGAMIYGATAVAVSSALAGGDLAAVLHTDPAHLAAQATARMQADERLASIGVEVIGVRFALLRAEPEVERAMQTPARELLQQEADKATFERRALAVEREAAIGENELANQIELARRQEQLIAQKGANGRRQAEEAAAADAVATRAETARTTAVAQAKAEAERALGAATAANEEALLAAQEAAGRDVLLALAMRELARNLPDIDQLVITPDVLTGLLSRLGASEAQAVGAGHGQS